MVDTFKPIKSLDNIKVFSFILSLLKNGLFCNGLFRYLN